MFISTSPYTNRDNKHQSGGESVWIQKIDIINNNLLLYLLKRVNRRLILALNTSPARTINCLAAKYGQEKLF